MLKIHIFSIYFNKPIPVPMVMDAHTYTLGFTMVTHTHSGRYGFLAGTGMCTPKFIHGLPVLITRSNQGPRSKQLEASIDDPSL